MPGQPLHCFLPPSGARSPHPPPGPLPSPAPRPPLSLRFLSRRSPQGPTLLLGASLSQQDAEEGETGRLVTMPTSLCPHPRRAGRGWAAAPPASWGGVCLSPGSPAKGPPPSPPGGRPSHRPRRPRLEGISLALCFSPSLFRFPSVKRSWELRLHTHPEVSPADGAWATGEEPGCARATQPGARGHGPSPIHSFTHSFIQQHNPRADSGPLQYY